MPKQIKHAIIAIVISFLIGGVDLLFQFANITKQDTEFSSVQGLIGGVLFTGILLFLIVKRYNWARWVFIILTAIGILLIIPIFIAEIGSDIIGAISTAIQTALQGVAVVLMLQQPVNQWFKNKNEDG